MFSIVSALLCLASIVQAVVEINEFHYDNINADVNEFIEFRHSEPLKGYEAILYNGYNGLLYNRTDLSRFPPTTVTRKFNYTVVPFSQIANGVEGIALKAPNGTVLEFLSYEGTFTAVNGPAKGMQSMDIKVSESNVCTSTGFSLQKCANKGLWIGPNVATPGKLNRNCTSATKAPSPAPCGNAVPSPVATPISPPTKSDTPPVTPPVTAPVTPPVTAPVTPPVTAPVMQPPTKSDAPTKCGLFQLGIFCPLKNNNTTVPSPVAAPISPPTKSDTPTAPVASPIKAPITPPATAPVTPPVSAPVMQPPTKSDAPTNCGLFQLGIFCPLKKSDNTTYVK